MEGLSTKQIASEFFCSTTAIKDHLHKFGIPLRKVRHHHGNPSIPKYGTKVRKGRSEPHLAERRTIRAVLDLTHAGLSLRQISRFLTEMGVPTKQRGKAWHPQMVKRILDHVSETLQESCEEIKSKTEEAS